MLCAGQAVSPPSVRLPARQAEDAGGRGPDHVRRVPASEHGFDAHFVAHYAVPLVSCVWSSGRETALLYPARYLFQFLDHHGMLSVTGSPQWFTVTGGSAAYVERLSALLSDVRTSRAVTDVTRSVGGRRRP